MIHVIPHIAAERGIQVQNCELKNPFQDSNTSLTKNNMLLITNNTVSNHGNNSNSSNINTHFNRNNIMVISNSLSRRVPTELMVLGNHPTFHHLHHWDLTRIQHSILFPTNPKDSLVQIQTRTPSLIVISYLYGN